MKITITLLIKKKIKNVTFDKNIITHTYEKENETEKPIKKLKKDYKCEFMSQDSWTPK